MPSLNGTSSARAPPSSIDIRPQSPYKQNGIESLSPRSNHREDRRARHDQPAHNHSSVDRTPSRTRSESDESLDGMNGVPPELAPLQAQGLEQAEGYEPALDDNPASYDLLAPTEFDPSKAYSLEKRALLLFSQAHLQVIFNDPALLFRFTAFLTSHRTESLPLLVYYLDTLKAIRAIHYANAISEGLDPVKGHDFTTQPLGCTSNQGLEERAKQAFELLAREDLPAYITHRYMQVVTLSIAKRVTGALESHLREASEGLAEVFCLTDPAKPDNPIVFASEGALQRYRFDNVDFG
jgi:hypothetical protein